MVNKRLKGISPINQACRLKHATFLSGTFVRFGGETCWRMSQAAGLVVFFVVVVLIVWIVSNGFSAVFAWKLLNLWWCKSSTKAVQLIGASSSSLKRVMH